MEKSKNFGQVFENEQIKRAKFDGLATGATADLWHPNETASVYARAGAVSWPRLRTHQRWNLAVRAYLPFEIKRLAFGGGDVPNPQMQLQPTIEAIERSDFLMERRAGAPYEVNRYFCAAPIKTAEHNKVLEPQGIKTGQYLFFVPDLPETPDASATDISRILAGW